MLLIAKLLVTLFTVLFLARVAERLGPSTAGLLAGFPLGSAIALYFFGWEQGVNFAAQSAVYTLSGLTSAIMFAYSYWLVIRRMPQMSTVPWAVLAGFIGFFASNGLLQHLPPWLWLHALVIILAIVLFRTLLKEINAQRLTQLQAIENHLTLPWLTHPLGLLLYRALLVAIAILLVTSVAEMLGPERAGLLAAFPMSFFPMLLILHTQWGASHAAQSIRHYPDGLGALVCYCLAVTYWYPLLGLHWGTLASLGVSVVYLVLYWQLNRLSLGSRKS